MNKLQRVRRQQLLREAEGYLDLLLAFADRWALRPEVRDRVAQRALYALEDLRPEDSHRAAVLYLRGQALRCMERYMDAVESLRQSADADSDNLHVWLALGWCHKRCGRIDLAIQALEEGLLVDSTEAIVHYNLACYWSLAGNAKQAVRYLGQAFDMDSNYRDLVPLESDFDPIRDHPDFQALTSVGV